MARGTTCTAPRSGPRRRSGPWSDRPWGSELAGSSRSQNPNVAVGCDGDALHQPELAVEGDAFRLRQLVAVLVQNRNELASVAGETDGVLSIDSGTEGAPLHSAAGEAG